MIWPTRYSCGALAPHIRAAGTKGGFQIADLLVFCQEVEPSASSLFRKELPSERVCITALLGSEPVFPKA